MADFWKEGKKHSGGWFWWEMNAQSKGKEKQAKMDGHKTGPFPNCPFRPKSVLFIWFYSLNFAMGRAQLKKGAIRRMGRLFVLGAMSRDTTEGVGRQTNAATFRIMRHSHNGDHQPGIGRPHANLPTLLPFVAARNIFSFILWFLVVSFTFYCSFQT
jgi:hypothetical protein